MKIPPRQGSGAGTIDAPRIDSTEGFTQSDGWLVTVFNNEVNTYDEVMVVLMVATRCSADEAYLETWEVDHLGASVVHHAAEAECRRVAAIIGTIGIRAVVDRQA